MIAELEAFRDEIEALVLSMTELFEATRKFDDLVCALERG